MKTHLTNREIDDFVSGLSSAEGEGRVREHIALCPQCRALTSTLSAAVTGEPSAELPGDHVRESVISEWYRMHEIEVLKKDIAKPRFSRLVAGLATAASAVIAVSVYFIISTMTVNGAYPLEVSEVSGRAYINSSMPAINQKLSPGDIIVTGRDSSLSASVSGYEIFLGRSSSVEIVHNSIDRGLRFMLRHGSVVSRSSGSVEYSFECGGYSIVPAGTEFMLSYSDGRLFAAVSQGKVVIADSEFRIEISAGEKWSSDNRESLEHLDKETEQLLKSPSGGVWPSEAYLKNRGAIINEPANRSLSGEEPVIKTAEENNEESVSSVKDLREKQENIRANRELREDMNSIKKEQRDGKRLRNRE
ncbi:MAG: hypothetical protein CVV49_04785 [Spirochaetae bacterium HGW-Spirochaetae-5]|nr:MAG: hypothetical protein CVV49_04785 [Spirochaetae bacterium HGW-Spirochaetae-5]